ncbi:MAG: hypothetical protein QOJ12_1728, partial [Thermoleophilales bacterium]|nr:hypothetical protein [Thermoleophilales bacterium]
ALPAAAVAKKGDRNHNGLPDKWEKKYKATSATADLDGDGLTNLGEYRSGTNPRKPDSDNDGTPDSNEDPDRDKVDNFNEVLEGTDPADADTDNDRKKDGAEDADRDALDNAGEDATGNDPTNPDSDGDGVKDGKETTGRVVSFDGTELKIRLASGRTVSGVVDEATDISCDDERGYEDQNDNSDDASLVDDSGDTSTDGSGDDPGADPASSGDDSADASVDTGADDPSAADPSAGGPSCDTSALTPGAVVHDAELEQIDGEAVFTLVELVG